VRLRTQVAGLVAVGALATVLNVAGGFFLVVGATRWQDAAAMKEVLDARYPDCADAPQSWSVTHRGFAAFAFDPATGTSLHPDAPPHHAHGGPRRPLDWSETRGAGPCGEVVVFSLMTLPRTPFPVGLLLAVVVPAVLSVAAGARVARQLVERVEAMVRATRRLGEPEPLGLDEEGEVDELRALSAALSRAHERIRSDATALRERQEATERHLRAVAHDLRTPLAHLQLQLEGLPSSDAVTTARRELAYLVALTDNLHQQARMDGGLSMVDTGRFDLRETVQRLGVRFGVLAELTKVSLSGAVPDDPVWVRGDEDLAERALGNLLHNAVRHGAGQVGYVLDRTPEGFRFQVHDDGPGLPAAVSAALSEGHELPRPEARTRGQGGLGLPIVREVVTRHGWRLEVLPGEAGASLAVIGPATVSNDG